MTAEITPFFDPATFTWSYVVADPATRACAIIDSVLDFDPASGKLSSTSAERLMQFIKDQGLTVDWLLETHVHADHLTASHYLQEKLGGRIGIGNQVGQVQSAFGPVFNAGADFRTDGSQFDSLFADGEEFSVGELQFRVMHTPGHTPACATYLVDGNAFVGDTLFMPDYGTARTDFPGGDAGILYDSIQKILSLPDDTVLYMCHDYLTGDRKDYLCKTSVAEEKHNIHLHGNDKAAFVHQRQCKDKGLAAPRLLLPSIQVNMRAGELPAAENNDKRYLRIPLRMALS
ncbi:MAG: MBL fold metallo-hydrolase [Pseudomonadales bacterium]|nr:MBL fold metallo-hydrolase [Pseudomonadales bacterium]